MIGDRSADRHADVVVVGSGAAGLTAALAAADGGCSVEILEKSGLVGGATAVSAGGLWVPLNPHMCDMGVEDTREEAVTYLRGLTQGREPDPHLIDIYVDEVRNAMSYLETSTPLRLQVSKQFSDYYADRPGGKRMGRTLHPLAYEARAALKEWDALIRESPHFARVTVEEWGDSAGDTAGGLEALAADRQARGIRTLGGALVACLLYAVLERHIPLRTSTRVVDLLIEDGCVTGVAAECDGHPLMIGAERGVVLASGGFEWNADLMHAFVGARGILPTSPPTNEGDGLLMALDAGAAVGNMTVTWAYPVSSDGRSTFEGSPLAILRPPQREAGTIIVNRRGRRFANEGVSYMDFPKTYRTYDPVTNDYPNEPPVWEIFDQSVRERMVLADLRPAQPTPAWVYEASTIAELADAIGVRRDDLCAEVERFNAHVARGVDSDYGRGTVWFEGYLSGGPRPEGSLAPIHRPPFYAVPVYEGAQGTAGGVRIDQHGRVRAMRGGVVPGLYAAGNMAASVFGPVYPAAGAILGQAIAFGYLAGRDLAHSTTPRD